MRVSTFIGLVLLFLLPLDVAAFWFGADGQCFDDAASAWGALDHSEDVAAPDCDDAFDPADPSYNACFELAEHPISTLPQLVAENQAQHVVAAVLGTTSMVVTESAAPLTPSPSEASVEDPELPGRELVERVAPPRPSPNACSVYPDDCERAPVIPNLNLEASTSPAASSSADIEYPPHVELPSHRGPPSPGLGPAAGIVTRLDRPPQVG